MSHFEKFQAACLLALCLLCSGVATAEVDIYVSPGGSNVTGDGSSGNPYASLAKAQLAVRAVTNRNQPINVYLGDGTYYLPFDTAAGTLVFNENNDSGSSTANLVTWTNVAGATPVVSGGVPLGAAGLNLTWSHSAGNLWQVTLPTPINGNPIQPFESLFYNGTRRLRPRVQSSSPTSVGYYMKAGACYSTQTKQTVDPSNCNLGAYLRIAGTIAPTDSLGTNCPSTTNSANSSQSKCLDRFKYNPADTITAFGNLNPIFDEQSNCPLALGGNPYPKGDVEVTLFNTWAVRHPQNKLRRYNEPCDLSHGAVPRQPLRRFRPHCGAPLHRRKQPGCVQTGAGRRNCPDRNLVSGSFPATVGAELFGEPWGEPADG